MYFSAIKKTQTGKFLFHCLTDTKEQQCLVSRPLDEAKKVKDKFDDIFNTTRYVKCQDDIRKEMNEQKSSKSSIQGILKPENSVSFMIQSLFEFRHEGY